MTIVKILIMALIVGLFAYTLYGFIKALISYIKAKKQKQESACVDDGSNSNKEVS